MKKLIYIILFIFLTVTYSNAFVYRYGGGVATTSGLTCTHGSGDSALFSHTDTPTMTTSAISDTKWKAIYFTTTATTRFTSIDIYTGATSVTNYVTVEIYNVSTYPTSIANVNATKQVTIPVGSGVYSFDFATPFSLAAGNYAVVVKGYSLSDYGIGGQWETPTIGDYYFTTNSGSSWAITSGLNIYLVIYGCQ